MDAGRRHFDDARLSLATVASSIFDIVILFPVWLVDEILTELKFVWFVTVADAAIILQLSSSVIVSIGRQKDKDQNWFQTTIQRRSKLLSITWNGEPVASPTRNQNPFGPN